MKGESKNNRNVILNAFSLTAKNLWGIFKIVVIFYILLTILSGALTYAGISIGNFYGENVLSGISIAVVLGAVFILLIIQSFTDAGSIMVVYESIHGRKMKTRTALKEIWKKKWRLIGAAILTSIITGIAGFLMSIISFLMVAYIGASGRIFAIILSLAVTAIAGLLISFIVPLIMIKDYKVFAALKRSVRLMFTTDGKVILNVLGLMLVAFIIMVAFNFLRLIPNLSSGMTLAITYLLVLVGQLSLVYIEVGKILIFNEYE